MEYLLVAVVGSALGGAIGAYKLLRPALQARRKVKEILKEAEGITMNQLEFKNYLIDRFESLKSETTNEIEEWIYSDLLRRIKSYRNSSFRLKNIGDR